MAANQDFPDAGSTWQLKRGSIGLLMNTILVRNGMRDNEMEANMHWRVFSNLLRVDRNADTKDDVFTNQLLIQTKAGIFDSCLTSL